jgi:hypothetical protein
MTFQQIPGVYHNRIGDIAVTALSDGTLVRGLDLLRSITVEESEALFRDAFRPGVQISVNAFLLRMGTKLVLIETGSGKYLGDSAGHLLANLRIAGVDPDRRRLAHAYAPGPFCRAHGP